MEVDAVKVMRKRATSGPAARAMTCAELIERLGAYHDRRMPLGRRLLIEAHVGQCRKCRDYVAAYATTVELAKAAMKHPAASAGDQMPEDLVQAILAARPRRK
jgi:predicted anti-sigma-YlaC factor YlaD